MALPSALSSLPAAKPFLETGNFLSVGNPGFLASAGFIGVFLGNPSPFLAGIFFFSPGLPITFPCDFNSLTVTALRTFWVADAVLPAGLPDDDALGSDILFCAASAAARSDLDMAFNSSAS